MKHITMPDEIVKIIDEVLGTTDNLHVPLLDITAGAVPNLTLDDAFNELDLWHRINIWSNGPVVVLDTEIDTASAIERFRTVFDDPTMRRRVAQHVSPEMADVFVRMYTEGPDDAFKTTMMTLRETFRPDRPIGGMS